MLPNPQSWCEIEGGGVLRAMPKSSSPSPTITPMNPIKTPHSHPQTLTLTPQSQSQSQSLALAQVDDDDELLRPYDLLPHSLLMDDDDDPSPDQILVQPPPPTQDGNHHHMAQRQPTYSSLIFQEDEEEEEEEEIDGEEPEEERRLLGENPCVDASAANLEGPAAAAPVASVPYVDPSPHVSSQFYTFNRESHALMVRCILECRAATPDEIRAATPRPVLKSWRSVWKDRNEDTAYLTAWKRIQDKLQARGDAAGSAGSGVLYFKSNPSQYVSHVEQWQDIVAASHADADLRHLGLKETVDRIKQGWTVGAKFYGIPESFIRVCVAACPVCSSASASNAGGHTLSGPRSKRRRFEYTESFDVPACDVPRRLQLLAAKHKVVLCIRQKYIRYKPFMAEVKDYACHRAGEPSSTSTSSKKARVLKREPYTSKRCGCGFRIRAIVPIANYNEKDKTFVYQEEGTAVFKLYAVHSGHEPGPLDGNARIIHRLVGSKGAFDDDLVVYGVRDDMESESFVNLLGKDDGSDGHLSVLQQVQELRVEAGLLEGKIAKLPRELLGSVTQELSDILHRIRSVGSGSQHSDDALVVGDEDVPHWGSNHHHHLDRQGGIFGKGREIMEEEETDFDHPLGPIVPWGRMAEECEGRKMLITESCKSEKWLMKEDCGEFDEKSILNCGEEEEEDSKLIKPIRRDGTIGTDPSLVGMHVDGFYPDTTKWYDSPSGLDPGGDSVVGGYRHGRIV